MINTRDGADLFKAKLAIAARKEAAIIAAHPGLRTLTSTERENMALVLYGPYASASSSKQYYVPVADAKGKWTWSVNTLGNANGVAYAQDVVSKIQ